MAHMDCSHHLSDGKSEVTQNHESPPHKYGGKFQGVGSNPKPLA